MIVVSEIGEQWSPHTAPAMQAEMQIMLNGLSAGNTCWVMGIKIPKVPQLVPVAKANRHPTKNTVAGRNTWNPSAELLTICSTSPTWTPDMASSSAAAPSCLL